MFLFWKVARLSSWVCHLNPGVLLITIVNRYFGSSRTLYQSKLSRWGLWISRIAWCKCCSWALVYELCIFCQRSYINLGTGCSPHLLCRHNFRITITTLFNDIVWTDNCIILRSIIDINKFNSWLTFTFHVSFLSWHRVLYHTYSSWSQNLPSYNNFRSTVSIFFNFLLLFFFAKHLLPYPKKPLKPVARWNKLRWLSDKEAWTGRILFI